MFTVLPLLLLMYSVNGIFGLLVGIWGYSFGAAIAILQLTPAEKRIKYFAKALGFFLGISTSYLGYIFLDLLVAHFHRRKAYKIWKANKKVE